MHVNHIDNQNNYFIWHILKVIRIRMMAMTKDHQYLFPQTVREVFAPTPHLLASSQASPLPPSRHQPTLKQVPVVTSSAGALWSLGHGVRTTAAQRGRKPAEASLPPQQVVVVSSPDSPTSEESSPTPSPESEVKKSMPPYALLKGLLAQKSGGFNGLLPSSSRDIEGENGVEDQQQQQIQTPTSSTTTEDSRKEAGREADEEGSDEVKEEDGEDEDATGMEDDIHTITAEEE